jgi:uncharacterized coiled-coil DUF342 family protein
MFLFAALLVGAVQAAHLRSDGQAGENPIRKIVSLLQKMQKEVSDEQAKDTELNEKFVCYCETNDGELSDSTASLRAQIPEIEASISESVNLKTQLDGELVQHKADRKAAGQAIESSTKRRAKEAAVYEADSGVLKGDIASCKAAIEALTKGLTGSFMQTPAASSLRNLVLTRASLDRYARDTLVEFLSVSHSAHYTPVSQEVIGIISQLQADMEKELEAITKVENDAITTHEGLVSAKEKEIAAATAAIESKTERAGEVAVEIVSLKNDLEDVKQSLGADELFLMELKKNCGTKSKEYDERKKLRAEELVAISETIKILNDDDSLDLFKKTLPSPTLLQISHTRKDTAADILAKLNKVKLEKGVQQNTMLNMITLALHGKKAGFEKVIKMIDTLVEQLAKEQTDDDAHKAWCIEEFDTTDDSIKGLKRRIAGLETKLTEAKEGIATLVEDLAVLKKGIKELDRAVEDATTQRKDEHKEFVAVAAENNAALQLLEVARNRMAKFYSPTTYVGPERRELTADEKLYVKAGGEDPRIAEEEAAAPTGGIAGTGVDLPDTVFVQVGMVKRDAPPPPPETAEAYSKKDAGGPLALIGRLKRDLERDIKEAEYDEEDSQKEYERFMSDSVLKRTADSKAITEKEAQKAELEADVMGATDLKGTKTAELLSTQEYESQLHGSCDFMMQNHDLRKKARANEVDALKNAKAVLSGADYSFQQLTAQHFLQRHS